MCLSCIQWFVDLFLVVFMAAIMPRKCSLIVMGYMLQLIIGFYIFVFFFGNIIIVIIIIVVVIIIIIVVIGYFTT